MLATTPFSRLLLRMRPSVYSCIPSFLHPTMRGGQLIALTISLPTTLNETRLTSRQRENLSSYRMVKLPSDKIISMFLRKLRPILYSSFLFANSSDFSFIFSIIEKEIPNIQSGPVTISHPLCSSDRTSALRLSFQILRYCPCLLF